MNRKLTYKMPYFMAYVNYTLKTLIKIILEVYDHLI